ncbi:MAG: hypothetical protein ACOC44_12395 [Promethearchaeia archaeon]
MKCKECGKEMDSLMLCDEFGSPLYVAEYECKECNLYYDLNGDWWEIKKKEGEEDGV